MNTLDEILFIILTALIFIFLRDIKELIIPTKKRRADIIGLVIGILAIIVIAYRYSSSIFHYIIGLLGIVAFVLSVFRVGISSSGFKPNQRGPINWPWSKIDTVKIIMKKDLILEIYRKDTTDIHIYKKEDYDKIMELLKENLPRKAIKINW